MRRDAKHRAHAVGQENTQTPTRYISHSLSASLAAVRVLVFSICSGVATRHSAVSLISSSHLSTVCRCCAFYVHMLHMLQHAQATTLSRPPTHRQPGVVSHVHDLCCKSAENNATYCWLARRRAHETSALLGGCIINRHEPKIAAAM